MLCDDLDGCDGDGWDGDRWDGVRGGMQRGVGREQREGLYVYLQLIHIVTAETNML